MDFLRCVPSSALIITSIFTARTAANSSSCEKIIQPIKVILCFYQGECNADFTFRINQTNVCDCSIDSFAGIRLVVKLCLLNCTKVNCLNTLVITECCLLAHLIQLPSTLFQNVIILVTRDHSKYSLFYSALAALFCLAVTGAKNLRRS